MHLRKARTLVTPPPTPLRDLPDTLQPKDIQQLARAELLRLRQQLHLGDNWNTIEVPAHWLPPGSPQQVRRLRVRALLQPCTRSKADLDLALLRVNQFLLLAFLVPVAGGRGVRLLSITTVMRSVESFARLLRLTLLQPVGAKGKLLDRLRQEDLRGNRQFMTEAARIGRLAQRGLWTDRLEVAIDHSLEQSRRAKDTRLVPPPPQPFLPLPDNFVAEAGWRLAWITTTLGPVLVNCAEGVAARFSECEESLRYWTLAAKNMAVRPRKPPTAPTVIRKYLDQFAWVDECGTSLPAPPFEVIHAPTSGGSDWPPRTWSQVKELLKALQAAHLFIFLLSTGGRIGEALSLESGCVVEGENGMYTVDGRTYKLVFADGGATRDWPLPALGVQAIRQQERLAVALDAIGRMDLAHALKRKREKTSSIWKSVGSQGKGYRNNYNHLLRRTMDVLGVHAWMDEEPLSAHRFRKTIARLIALALVDAPKILMDLFGHKSIEMTLHYILTDPGIRSEMAEVAKAQVIMLAKEAIRDADDLGGPAASSVRRAVKQERARLGEQFGESELHRLAETMTFSGRAWQLVRPGVICTKGPQQAGPCSKSRGQAEPARCRSHCDHRLERGFLREDTDQAIAQAVELLQAAEAADDPIGAEMWRGQVLNHLPRFADLEQKWRRHPVVAAIGDYP